MKLNNKGFAVSTIMYLILVLAVVLMVSTLFTLNSRNLILDRQKANVLSSIYKICDPVTLDSSIKDSNGLTLGQVPNGNYELGDEYICNVDGLNKYHFYILSVDDNNVNLILSHSINSNGSLTTSAPVKYSNESLVRGPITTFDFLEKATLSWVNIPNMEMNYTYSVPPIGGFKTTKNQNSNTIMFLNESNKVVKSYVDMKVRIPYEDEVNNACSSGNCNWLKNNIGDLGYWVILKYMYDFNIFSSDGLVDAPSTGNVSARPVITVKKSDLSG